MTWDLTLYTIIQDLPRDREWFFGWWTVVRGACVVGLVYWMFGKKDTIKVTNDIVVVEPLEKITSEELRSQIELLQSQIWSLSTTEWYRQFQSLLRQSVYQSEDIDIFHVTFQSLQKLDLDESFVELLKQTYYFPYREDQGELERMEQDLSILKSVFSKT